jgi:phage shock protein A
MPGLAGRMSTTIKAKISKMLDRAEDPAETLDYGYRKQQEHLQGVKKGIADVVTAKKRIQMQSKKLEEQVVKLDTQARQAISQNREDLARMALERKTAIQTELQGLDTQVTQLEQQQEQLIENEKRLRAKIEAFRTKKEVIKAQYSAAEAQVMISEAASGVGEEMADLGLAMQRAEEKTEDMKARANAVGELESAGVFEDITQLEGGSSDIDRELAQLSQGAQVDEELAKMKAELGSGGDAPALEEGQK